MNSEPWQIIPNRPEDKPVAEVAQAVLNQKWIDMIEEEQIAIVFGSLFGEPRPMYEDTNDNKPKEQEEC